MTRINSDLDPKILADQHLMAEYNEFGMFFSSLRRSLKSKKGLPKIPDRFTLNSGHVTFFYTKIGDMRVVHGHTPPRFEHFHHRINLDTGCVFGTALTAVIFKDDKTSIKVLQVPGLPSREGNYN